MNFDLRQQTLLFTIAGSRAYGIHTFESDVDCKGVCIPPRDVLLGFEQGFEQADKKGHMLAFIDTLNAEEQLACRNGLEGTVYGLHKFMALACDANPNILDVLFCRDEDVRVCTRLGEMLRSNRDLFLSTKAKFTFSGYAVAQLKRIKLHRRWLLNPPKVKPERTAYGLPIDHKIVRPEQLNALMMLTKEELGHLGFNEQGVELIHKEKAYSSAKADWDSYENWKATRNPARAELEAKYGYDVKHAGHLYRLMTMGVEIMTTGKVNVWRGDIDAEQIMSIRRGAWEYDALVEWSEKKDAELTVLYEEGQCVLPKSPSRISLNALCVKISEQALWGRM